MRFCKIDGIETRDRAVISDARGSRELGTSDKIVELVVFGRKPELKKC